MGSVLSWFIEWERANRAIVFDYLHHANQDILVNNYSGITQYMLKM